MAKEKKIKSEKGKLTGNMKWRARFLEYIICNFMGGIYTSCYLDGVHAAQSFYYNRYLCRKALKFPSGLHF